MHGPGGEEAAAAAALTLSRRHLWAERGYQQQLLPLVYLGSSVLLLLQEDSTERFWPVLELWLASQRCAESGLAPAPPDASRLSVVCLRATPRSLEASLRLDDLAVCEPRKLHALLPRPNRHAASRPVEKAVALASILRVDRLVRELSFELTDICAGIADALAHALERCGCTGA